MTNGGTIDDRIETNCPHCGAPVMLDPPTWQSPAAGWCWRCDRRIELGAPKAEPARDAWVLELFDATAQEAAGVVAEARDALGLSCRCERGTVAGVFFKRSRGIE